MSGLTGDERGSDVESRRREEFKGAEYSSEGKAKFLTVVDQRPEYGIMKKGGSFFGVNGSFDQQ